MKVKLGEIETDVAEGMTLYQLRDQYKPGADVVVLNGAPMKEDHTLSEGDAVVLIQRGEVPGPEEMEALMMARHTPGVHQKIKQATVGIAGAGGLGSAIAIALARIGVGRLVLADFDVVEPSNLNRQQFFVDQLGQLKVDALCDNLKRINPYVELIPHAVTLTPENIPAIFSGVDVMVEAFDTAEGKAMLAESFAKHCPDKPVVMASGLAGYGPSNTVQTRKVGTNLYIIGDLVSAAGQHMGLMAPRVGVAAHHQANAVFRLLLGEEPEG